MNDNHHLYRRKNVWYVKFSRQGRPVRVSTKSDDVIEARRVRDELTAKVDRRNVERVVLRLAPIPNQDLVPSTEHVDSIANAMFKRAKSRARMRHILFDLTKADIRMLLEQSGWRCAVSGIKFEVGRDFTRSTGPFKPSLDRIDSREPYRLGNVRIVCCAANLAMNCWGLPTLILLAEAVVSHKSGQVENEATAKVA